MTTATLTQRVEKLEQQATFWALPQSSQEDIIYALPGKSTWILNLIRTEEGLWYFDLPHYGIFRELLMDGTEEALDWHYENLTGIPPEPFAEMEMIVSTNPVDDAATALYYCGEDADFEDASYYEDGATGIICWLCPMLVYMFKYVPEVLYVDFLPESWVFSSDDD
jgi:hypothetical protein